LIGAAAATSLIAGLATAPFAAFHFNRFADYGVVANVIVTPIVSFIIMPAGVLALVLMPFGLEAAPLAVMSEGIEAMLTVAHWVASWPGATQSVAAWPVESLSLVAFGGLWLAVWQAHWRWLGLIPIVGGLALALMASPPDVLVAGDGSNIAIRGADGRLELLSSRRGRFDAEIWLRRDGDQREVTEAVPDEGRGFVCDSAGCIAHVRGRPQNRVVIAWSAEAIADDCGTATVVIDLTRGWAPGCSSPSLALSRQFLDREGAIAIWLDGSQSRWTSVARERGNRPWSQ
jgi:competence protein ComEC